MKKIIAALDGLKFSQNATDYAIQFAKLSDAHLVGIFLDDFTYHSYKIYELINNEGGVSEEKMERFEQQDKISREEATKTFEEACNKAGVNHAIHHDKNIAIQELLHESIYADLLVIDSKETFTHYEENLPTHFIRNLLIKSECPVLVVPGQYKPVEKLVLLFDGEPSSVFAIKMFSCMFPALTQLSTEVISVKSGHQTKHVPDNHLMKEFMKRHFSEPEYTVLQGLPDVEIIKHLKYKNQHALIVLGAYERGQVSRWLSPSLADGLMQELRSPLFIAHTK